MPSNRHWPTAFATRARFTWPATQAEGQQAHASGRERGSGRYRPRACRRAKWMNMTSPPTTVRLQNVAQSYGQSAALMAAVEIGVFTAISNGAGTYEEVARAVDIHPTNAERLKLERRQRLQHLEHRRRRPATARRLHQGADRSRPRRDPLSRRARQGGADDRLTSRGSTATGPCRRKHGSNSAALKRLYCNSCKRGREDRPKSSTSLPIWWMPPGFAL